MVKLITKAPDALRIGTALNATTWGANKFSARLLLPGLVSYEDSGCGIALLTKESIDRGIQSFIGKPLILARNGRGAATLKHDKITPENHEDKADGYITEVYFNAEDGWFWCSGIVFTDEAKDAIRGVGKVSCAYRVTQCGTGGTLNQVKYDQEILNFDAEHLAIVARPRYETATIRLNSVNKPNSNTMKLKFWKKKSAEPTSSATEIADAAAKAAAEAQRLNATESTEVSLDTEVELEGGEKTTLRALVDARNAAKDIEGEDEVDIGDGKKAKLNDVIAGYKKNAVAEEAAKKKEEDDKKNAADEEEKKAKDEEEKKNKKNSVEPAKKTGQIAKLHMARNAGGADLTAIQKPCSSVSDRVARGQERYGSKPAAK